MRYPGVLVGFVVLGAAILAGCGESDDGTSATEATKPELVVFAAASLGPAFEEYGDRFADADVKFSFAGSDELAAQIRQGVAPDVYAAANTALPDELFKEDLIGKPTTFVTNRLVVGVPADSDINEISDLEEPGVSIAIGDEDVPVGIYTREVLDALGPEAKDAILANVASSEPDVAGIVGKLTQGAVDAGFIYKSDVDATDGSIKEIEIPKAASPDIAYGIAVATGAEQSELAHQFVDGAISGEGQVILLESGFGAAPE